MRVSKVKDLPLRWPIRTRLIVIFLVLSIIPMSAIAYFNLAQSKSEITRIAEENLIGLSHGTAHRIEQLLIENQRTSRTLAGEPNWQALTLQEDSN